MRRSYLLSLDFKVTSLTEWAAQLKINLLKRYLLNSSYRNWKTLLSPFLKSLMALAGMVLLWLLLQENESIVFVIVPLKVSMTVPVTGN